MQITTLHYLPDQPGDELPRYPDWFAANSVAKSWFTHHTKVDYQDFEAIILDQLL
jgi:hypothetical protein